MNGPSGERPGAEAFADAAVSGGVRVELVGPGARPGATYPTAIIRAATAFAAVITLAAAVTAAIAALLT